MNKHDYLGQVIIAECTNRNPKTTMKYASGRLRSKYSYYLAFGIIDLGSSDAASKLMAVTPMINKM